MSLANSLKKHSLAIGTGAMILIIMGTVVEGGSLLQKLLFVIGALILGFVAYLDKQKVLLTLEIIVIIGAILAFCSFLPPFSRYVVLGGAGIIGVVYLIRIKFSKEDVWWPIGGAGLLFLAVGLATDAVSAPILFNSLLGIGGILIAIYSAIGFFYLRVKIAIIWLILNLIFVINPLIIVFSRIV